MTNTDFSNLRLTKQEIKLLKSTKRKKPPKYDKKYDALIGKKPKLVLVINTEDDGYGGQKYTDNSVVAISEAGLMYIKHIKQEHTKRFLTFFLPCITALTAVAALLKDNIIAIAKHIIDFFVDLFY